MNSVVPSSSYTERDRTTENDLGVMTVTEGLTESNGCALVVVQSTEMRELCRRYELESEHSPVVIGRADDSAILLDSTMVSRHHAQLEKRDDGWWLVDNKSTNGTWFNGERTRATKLRHNDHLRVGPTTFKYVEGNDLDSRYLDALRQAMMTDGLTLTLTHAAFCDTLSSEFLRSRRYGRNLSLVMIDVDKFKRVNDTHGHLAGDHVLRTIAAVVRSRVRRSERVGRLGGEEFAVLLPETSVEGAVVLAEDLRRRVAESPFIFGATLMPMTVSLGVSSLCPEVSSPEHLLDAADKLLYEAKHAGGNRVHARAKS